VRQRAMINIRWHTNQKQNQSGKMKKGIEE